MFICERERYHTQQTNECNSLSHTHTFEYSRIIHNIRARNGGTLANKVQRNVEMAHTEKPRRSQQRIKLGVCSLSEQKKQQLHQRMRCSTSTAIFALYTYRHWTIELQHHLSLSRASALSFSLSSFSVAITCVCKMMGRDVWQSETQRMFWKITWNRRWSTQTHRFQATAKENVKIAPERSLHAYSRFNLCKHNVLRSRTEFSVIQICICAIVTVCDVLLCTRWP